MVASGFASGLSLCQSLLQMLATAPSTPRDALVRPGLSRIGWVLLDHPDLGPLAGTSGETRLFVFFRKRARRKVVLCFQKRRARLFRECCVCVVLSLLFVEPISLDGIPGCRMRFQPNGVILLYSKYPREPPVKAEIGRLSIHYSHYSNYESVIDWVGSNMRVVLQVSKMCGLDHCESVQCPKEPREPQQVADFGAFFPRPEGAQPFESGEQFANPAPAKPAVPFPLFAGVGHFP